MKLHRCPVIRGALRTTLRLCLFLIPCQGLAQPEIIAKFLAREHTFQGATLVYRLFVPEGYTPAKKYPIVLTLHGNTGQGSDNLRQIQGTRLATSWADPVNQAKYPCFVVSPQCRGGRYWVEQEAIGPDLATANNILDSLAREFSIDTTRMYVTGLSMGGYGTWHLITLFPDRFAGAVPVSASWWPNYAGRINLVPLWVFTGALDPLIPVEEVRSTIHGFRQFGRSVVYTHCNDGNCTGLPDSAIARYVRNHADLLYTETQGGGHDESFFNFAYDYPFLRPWLFDQIRITPGVVNLATLKSYRALHNNELIAWAAPNPSDSVEIRFSPDAGSTWYRIASSFPSSGSHVWNTNSVSDCAFGLLKIFLKNSSGQIYSYDQSAYVAIDNGTHSKPFGKILNQTRFWWMVIDSSAVSMRYLCGSSKRAPVNVRFYYSADKGLTFTQCGGHTAEGDTAARTLLLDLAALPNSEQAVLRVDVSDGISVSSDTTFTRYPFAKRTPRVAGPVPALVSGGGNGTVAVRIVDALKLTGHQYRVTFRMTPGLGKTYDVEDVTAGVTVVANATQVDGTTEGPMFDGIRLLVKDYREATVNKDSSRWERDPLTLLDVQIGVLNLNLGDQNIIGYPYPADYRISFYDHVVDTSREATFGTGRIPVNFTVWNITENRRSDFVFIDSDNNRAISNFDEVYILEPDSSGIPQLTWNLFFAAVQQATRVPGPGDRYLFKTLKPIRPGDTFEFRGVVTTVGAATVLEEPKLLQNYPNPFNPKTRVSFQLSATSKVRLVVYDILGREVATLVDEVRSAGGHTVQFDATGLASGVYFYRMMAGTYTSTRKLVVLR